MGGNREDEGISVHWIPSFSTTTMMLHAFNRKEIGCVQVGFDWSINTPHIATILFQTDF